MTVSPQHAVLSEGSQHADCSAVEQHEVCSAGLVSSATVDPIATGVRTAPRLIKESSYQRDRIDQVVDQIQVRTGERKAAA